MKAPYSMIPTLPLFIGVGVGIVASMAGLHMAWSVIPLVAGIALYFAGQQYAAIAVVAVAIGWCNNSLRGAMEPAPSLLEQKARFMGVVDQVNQGDDSRMIVVRVIKSPLATKNYRPFKCAVTLHTLRPFIGEGDTVSCYGTISKLSTRIDVPNEFNYASYLKRIGVRAQASVTSDSLIIKGRNNGLLYRLKRYRHDIAQLLYGSGLNDRASVFMATTLLGDTELLDNESRTEFSTAGLAHILALSGLHVGIITLILSILLYPLRLWSRMGRYYTILIIVCLWFYALLTGLSLSVTRAVIMATMLLLATALQRRTSSYNALFLAAIVIMLASPISIIQPGFQLSFCAVLAIITFNDKVNPVNPRRTILYNVLALFTVSLSAMLGTGLIAAYYFHQIPPYCILANVAVSWLLPIIVGLGVVMLALLAMGIDSTLMADAINHLHHVLEVTARGIASIPGASVQVKDFSPLTFVVYALCLVALYFTLTRFKVKRAVITALLGVATVLMVIYTGYRPAKCEIFIPADTRYTNILVHDRDSIYVISTANDAMGKNIIARYTQRYSEYLHSCGVSSLTFINQNDICNNTFLRVGNNVAIKDTRFVIITEQKDIDNAIPRPDYAIVTHSFKGDIVELARTLRPGEIILSRDINPIRCRRYGYALKLQNIKFTSIFDNKFHKIIDN